MRRSRRFFGSFTFAALFAIAGCGDIVGPGRDPSDLESNRRTWQTHGYHDYTATISTLCFCIEIGPFNITVLGDSLMSVTRASDGTPLDYRWLPTINKLFDFIERGIAERAVVLEVEYDAQLGFPRKVVYDRSFNIADEEVTYIVTDVRPIMTGSLTRR